MNAEIEPPENLLSVVTTPEGNVVYIHADRGGLETLRASIDHLLACLDQNDCGHDHLFSQDWAGWDLSTTMLEQEREAGCKTVHHIKIYAWDDEWKRKHGLWPDLRKA
jgi:hypothetical protein